MQKERGVFGITIYPRKEGSDVPNGSEEDVEVDGVRWEKGGRLRIEEVDFMVSYMSPRWYVDGPIHLINSRKS
jgi:hypothetical protein